MVWCVEQAVELPQQQIDTPWRYKCPEPERLEWSICWKCLNMKDIFTNKGTYGIKEKRGNEN